MTSLGSGSLTTWSQSLIRSVMQALSYPHPCDYDSPNDPLTTLKSTYDTLISPHANITLNGRHISRDHYLNHLISAVPSAALDRLVSLKFRETPVVEVGDADVPGVQEAALVALSYEATFESGFAGVWGDNGKRASERRVTVASSIHMIIRQIYTDGTVTDRKVVTINQILAELPPSYTFS